MIAVAIALAPRLAVAIGGGAGMKADGADAERGGALELLREAAACARSHFSSSGVAVFST